MAKRDFIYGGLIVSLIHLAIQDYYGLEGYITYLRSNWTEMDFALTATLATVVALMYFVNKPKTQTIVVEVGMEQVLSLQEGDIVTIQKRN
jgi:hypothetical protein